jgi:hypothetical protein
MWYFLSLFLFVIGLQFIFVLSIKKPALLKKKIKIDPTSTIFRAVVLTVMVIIYFLLVEQVIDFHRVKPYIGTAGKRLTKHDSPLYERLGYRDSKNVEIFYYLYTLPDKSQDVLQVAAVERRLADCKKACIVNFYDDKKAYDLDMQRLTITSKNVMEEWNKKNYIYVADHYLGYQGPSVVDTFAYYPFRDWYYKKIKGQK